MAEPLAIEFANTWYAVRGKEREGVGTTDELSAWLRQHVETAGSEAVAVTVAGEPDVARFLGLRDAIRTVLRAVSEDGHAPGGAVEIVNGAAASAPRWPVLTAAGDGSYAVDEQTAGDPLSAAYAAIARDAIGVVGGALRSDVRACHGPGCVQFFIKDHPRREWCSAGCGNRARAARHYSKSKEG